MYDVYGEACFSLKKKIYKWAKLGCATISLSWKWKKKKLSGKEKVLGAVVSKEGYTTSFLVYERTHHY